MSEATDKIQELLDERHVLYGDSTVNMEAMGKMVSGYLMGVQQRQEGRVDLNEVDFSMIMVLYKAYRFAVTPEYGDNLDDIEGYIKMIRKSLGERVVNAKSPTEYAQKRSGSMDRQRIVTLCEHHAVMHPYGGAHIQVVNDSTYCEECNRDDQD